MVGADEALHFLGAFVLVEFCLMQAVVGGEEVRLIDVLFILEVGDLEEAVLGSFLFVTVKGNALLFLYSANVHLIIMQTLAFIHTTIAITNRAKYKTNLQLIAEEVSFDGDILGYWNGIELMMD